MGRPPEEAEVRQLRDRNTFGLGDFADLRRLCDSWLAQAKVIEAARRDFEQIIERTKGYPQTLAVWSIASAGASRCVAAGGETETPGLVEVFPGIDNADWAGAVSPPEGTPHDAGLSWLGRHRNPDETAPEGTP